ncbi:MAG: hypothetical protein R2856_22515 [Caldilineaceae bacterium]
MSRATKGMNRHQKAAFRPGEHRYVGTIERLLELAQSDDPEDRLEAASNLCPCHLRRRIDEAWQALYRMMEDPDVRGAAPPGTRWKTAAAPPIRRWSRSSSGRCKAKTTGRCGILWTCSLVPGCARKSSAR